MIQLPLKKNKKNNNENKKNKKLSILYWHILISKLPRFEKACKRNLIVKVNAQNRALTRYLNNPGVNPRLN